MFKRFFSNFTCKGDKTKEPITVTVTPPPLSASNNNELPLVDLLPIENNN